MTAVKAMETIDAKPVRHGRWIQDLTSIDDDNNIYCTCSCYGKGDLHATTTVVPYCWFCGSKMDEDIITNCDKSDYEVLCRMWVRSDGVLIRNWTPHEYINTNPYDKIILSALIDKRKVDVEAHCLEIRNVYAHKDDNKVISFIEGVDYGEDVRHE